LKNIVQISAGSNHLVALADDGYFALMQGKFTLGVLVNKGNLEEK
jgi:alpha-tubulin suppressor-like RCC1 family protein